MEHLCLLHLQRARVLAESLKEAATGRALEEGLHLARRCGLGLYLIDLLCEQAERALGLGNVAAAESAAREALERASAADCRFAWGAAQAGHWLGEVLLEQENHREARIVLGRALDLRRALGDPLAPDTEELFGEAYF
jgi:HD superfamily phosphodiesterase